MMIQVIIKRFLKGFIAGGIASAVVVLNSGAFISSIGDVKKLGLAMAMAFIGGGLLAIEKALNFTQVAPDPVA